MHALKLIALRWWWFASMGCYATAAHSHVHEVPAEFPTIQAALGATVDGDTVRVAPGEYHEFLTCQTDLLTLTGWYSADTLPEQRTVLDPIPIGVDTPSAVVFTGDSIQVLNFSFYNRPEMRQPVWATRVGGIHQQGNGLTLRNCRFDSVSQAVYGGNTINAANCKYFGCKWGCLNPSAGGSVQAESCYFDGAGPFLVTCSSGSSIQNCEFLSTAINNDVLLLYGHDIEVFGCRFGPFVNVFPIVNLYTYGNCRVERCLFDGLRRTSHLIRVDMECPGPGGAPVTIGGNTFRDFQTEENSGGPTAIGLGCQTPGAGHFGTIENNIFQNGTSGGNPPGISVGGSIEIEHNIFENLRPVGVPDVSAVGQSSDTIIARDNQFLEPGIAATSSSYFDARWNWWGDSTGPFHAILNPGGLGSEVGNNVLFDPWYRFDPDTSFDTSHVTENNEAVFPNNYALRAYPNPFNATANLLIEVASPGKYEVNLYDVTGRAAARLFSGRIEREVQLNVSAEGFVSGVYFARLSSVEGSYAVVKLLLLK